MSEDKNNCSICLNEIENEFKTDCGHTFCVNCIHCYNKLSHNLRCPLCRQKILINKMPYYGKILPFDEKNYLENPDIREEMVLAGYKTILRLNKWKFLYDYEVNNNYGFIFDNNEEINNIMNEVSNDYNNNHSGFTMGYTMRQLQFIAYYGINRYIRIKNIN